MYASSPGWKDWISKDDLEKILIQLKRRIKPSPYGRERVSLNYGLHFTGGEPFLNFELLLEAIEIANELGIPSTFVETNCYWCKDDKVTQDKLKMLKEKGLKGILISVNPFFLEYVPFEQTERAIKISQKIFPHNVMIYQQEYYFKFKRLGIKGKIRFEDYLKLEGSIGENIELFLMGRAAYKLGNLYPKYPPDYFFGQSCLPLFFRDWHNHWDNFGNYIPGYCGGISLGDCRNLDKLLEEGINLAKYPVLKFLMSQDFKGLLQFSQDLGYKVLSEGYVSKCHLCLDIRSYLSTKNEFEELKPKEFYSQLNISKER
jgi:hypothetical protein